MPQWVRIRSSWLASALIVSLVAALASEAMPGHAGADHDAACAPLLPGSHDEGQHRLSNAAGSDAANAAHCLVCHWARSFRPVSPEASAHAPVHEPRLLTRSRASRTPLVLLSTQLTLRSPPVLT
jgi:hypothetical protein